MWITDWLTVILRESDKNIWIAFCFVWSCLFFMLRLSCTQSVSRSRLLDRNWLKGNHRTAYLVKLGTFSYNSSNYSAPELHLWLSLGDVFLMCFFLMETFSVPVHFWQIKISSSSFFCMHLSALSKKPQTAIFNFGFLLIAGRCHSQCGLLLL